MEEKDRNELENQVPDVEETQPDAENSEQEEVAQDYKENVQTEGGVVQGYEEEITQGPVEEENNQIIKDESVEDKETGEENSQNSFEENYESTDSRKDNSISFTIKIPSLPKFRSVKAKTVKKFKNISRRKKIVGVIIVIVALSAAILYRYSMIEETGFSSKYINQQNDVKTCVYSQRTDSIDGDDVEYREDIAKPIDELAGRVRYFYNDIAEIASNEDEELDKYDEKRIRSYKFSVKHFINQVERLQAPKYLTKKQYKDFELCKLNLLAAGLEAKYICENPEEIFDEDDLYNSWDNFNEGISQAYSMFLYHSNVLTEDDFEKYKKFTELENVTIYDDSDDEYELNYDEDYMDENLDLLNDEKFIKITNRLKKQDEKYTEMASKITYGVYNWVTDNFVDDKSVRGIFKK